MELKLVSTEPLNPAPPQTYAPKRPRIAEDSLPQVLIAWALERFAHQNIVMSTQFGMEGCALIDMWARFGVPLTVVYLDTMFFFAETYELRDRLMQRYPHLTFVNRGTIMTPEQQAEKHGPELWKSNPNQCCKIRKVDPMYDALAGADVWVTALRRGQSEARANIRVLDWDWKFQLIKLSPLANLTRADVWEYIQSHDVPYNPLHEQGYPSVGCTHCTNAVPGSTPADYTREGRWQGQKKKECGLHGDGI